MRKGYGASCQSGRLRRHLHDVDGHWRTDVAPLLLVDNALTQCTSPASRVVNDSEYDMCNSIQLLGLTGPRRHQDDLAGLATPQPAQQAPLTALATHQRQGSPTEPVKHYASSLCHVIGHVRQPHVLWGDHQDTDSAPP